MFIMKFKAFSSALQRNSGKSYPSLFTVYDGYDAHFSGSSFKLSRAVSGAREHNIARLA